MESDSECIYSLLAHGEFSAVTRGQGRRKDPHPDSGPWNWGKDILDSKYMLIK